MAAQITQSSTTQAVDPADFITDLHAEGQLRQRFKPLLAGYGMTRVADVTGLDDLVIPVTMAVRPLARTLSVAQGKGVTLDAAASPAPWRLSRYGTPSEPSRPPPSPPPLLQTSSCPTQSRTWSSIPAVS
ncbi:hypothetical protein [Streptomyces sp. NBC_01092]|uniref:hypothetical protein n=1 Tax=Streptomyces sp. NBC_01092 TaxID=2903748 RepID=UPI003868A930|nr:hypothetical protein OG254_01040 [Streptomyces sp. NBC_01092]